MGQGVQLKADLNTGERTFPRFISSPALFPTYT